MARKPDPRVIRTRQMLRESLIALIPNMGYDNLTIQDITDKAGLNRATFYLHYKDKHDLLTQIIDSVLEELAEVLEGSQRSSSDLQQIFVQVFEHVAKNVVFYRVMLQEASVADYMQRIQGHIQEIGMRALMSGSTPEREMLTPPQLFITFIGWGYIGVVKWWVLNDMPYTADYMAAQFVRLAISGLQREFGLGALMEEIEKNLSASAPANLPSMS